MTHTDAAPSRKPRRLGLYAPWAAAVLLMAGWSLAWVWLSGETARRLDAGAAHLRAEGWTVAWSARRIGGYPFRLDVDFDHLAVAEPSGWGIAAPSLKTEAYAWSPDHWMMFAPAGVTFTRPGDGPVQVSAQVLRASVSGWNDHPPRISVEGVELTFTPAPGAGPLPVTAAQGLQLHTLAGPNDQGAVFLSLDQATARPETLIGRLAEGKPVDLKADAIFTHAGALAGRDWPSAVRTWAYTGGALTLRQAGASAGAALIDAQSARLTATDDGRLSGSLSVSLPQAQQALVCLGARDPIPPATASIFAAAALAPTTETTLTFKDGQTVLDGAAIAPAPKVF